MKVDIRRSGEAYIRVRSSSGRDLGLFLIFLGLVGSAPIQYIVSYRLNEKFVEVTDWTPSAYSAIVLTILGLMFIFNTHKHILVRGQTIRMRDGLFHRPLEFTWKNGCSIKLRSIDEERRGRVQEVWLVKLVTGDYEYLLDARANQQLVSRGLAEALAKATGGTMTELEDGREIVIEARDLDLPFRERVRKYPLLLGSPVPPPRNLHGMVVGGTGDHRFFRWGLQASWLLLEILVLTLLALLASVIPFGGESLFDLATSTNNYSFYYTILCMLFASIVIVPGYQAQLVLHNHQTVSYQQLLWRIPVDSHSIAIEHVEEIRQHEGIRGPVVQIIADIKIISFRIGDRDIARWLAYEIGCYLGGQFRADAVAAS